MASYNSVTLVGNLTRDVELRYLQGGAAVADIGLAVNEVRKDREGSKVDETTFVDVTLWGRVAEIASEYLAKGSLVLIGGRLKLEQWTDKETGNKRSKLKVVGERLVMLGKREATAGGGSGGSSGGRHREASEADYYDDLPF